MPARPWRRMAEHIFSVLCEKGLLDKFTNSVCIFGVLDNISIRHPEGNAPEIGSTLGFQGTVVSLWVREKSDVPESPQMRLVLLPPDGKRVMSPITLEINLGVKARTRTFLSFNNVVYRGAGEYRFLVEQQRGEGEWEKAASLPFTVELTPVSPPDEASGTPPVP